MKKFFAKTVSAFLCMTFVIASAASAASIEITGWNGDYKNALMKIKVKSLVDYNQRVTAVVYPKGTANELANYERMDEFTLNAGEEKEFSFGINDDLSQTEYSVTLTGNGIGGSADTEEIILTRPKDNLLGEFNTATESTLDGVITKANVPLALKAGEEPRDAVRLNKFIGIRTYDYSASFKNLEDVINAWNISGVLAYLASSGAKKDELKAKVEADKEFFGIDTTTNDYNKYSGGVYEKLIQIHSSYNENKGIVSGADLGKAFNAYLALSVINSSSEEFIADNIGIYYQKLDIQKADYDKFTGLNTAQKQMVLRQVYGKNFTEPSLLKKAFTDALDRDFGSADPTPSPSPSPGNNSPGISGGSTNGGSTPTDNTKKEIFNDCTENHWAYKYVNELYKSNIVSGYGDSTFLPQNNVKREEFVKMAISAAGLYDKGSVCDFSDVTEDAWYYVYIASATKENIVRGTDNNAFGTGTDITREDAAVIAARILERFGKSDDAEKAEFTDSDSVSEYASSSIALLVKLGILNGYEDNSFKPKAYLTRAETAKIIYVLREMI